MKANIYLSFFLLFSISFYAQNDSIAKPNPQLSVVALDKMNVVYRGVSNPISIAVNDAKSFTVKGDTVFVSNGKYILYPRSNTESKVIVEIEKFDGSKVTEEHVFKVMGLPKGLGTINGENCDHCIIEMSKEELLNAEISATIPGFFYENKVFVAGFDVSFLDNDSSKTIRVEGNKFNKEINDKILNKPIGSYIIVHSIKASYSCDCNEFAGTIKIMIGE